MTRRNKFVWVALLMSFLAFATVTQLASYVNAESSAENIDVLFSAGAPSPTANHSDTRFEKE
jgi:hypothetical protein